MLCDKCKCVFCKCICKPICPPCPPCQPRVLGWMRSSEIEGYVPGARIPEVPEPDFNGWDFDWVRNHTFMQFFENSEILEAAIQGDYTREALRMNETLFPNNNILVDFTYVWDGGTPHQFFKDYSTEPQPGGWASWQNVNIPNNQLFSPQTREPDPEFYLPFHYSLRRFTSYLDVDLKKYTINSAFLVSAFPSDEERGFVFPLNDSIFVFVNGLLVYWTSTDLIGSGNVAQNRLFFNGLRGIYMDRNPRFDFTDFWYLRLGGENKIADIAPYLKNGKNVIDVIADDYFEGGGMSRIKIDFDTTPIRHYC